MSMQKKWILARNIYQKKTVCAEIIHFLKYYKQISGGKEKVGLKLNPILKAKLVRIV